ncbi:E3 ubiquitin-protein ligase TRIM71-like [Mytilus californianus]|uniref:E3 ubiquitin-protein ligase TRIM71-like n=1 Tax=Mytilus californianus TaxID=6549 RepID=UPI0022458FAA|nr:E3 ubiquitin-protein ligase TRIM71-like [Mytilus californianus]
MLSDKMAQAASKTCEICISASGSQYCLECEQYFCENCKTFHNRQKISKTHQFQSALDVIPEGKSKCKDHNEDVSFVCNACNVAVCSSCVTGSHKRHDFSKLHDSISQLKATNEQELCRKVQEATKNMKRVEEGLNTFDMKVEVVVKAITENGSKIKAMVDTHIAQMIASVKDQSRMERDKMTKIIADTRMDLKVGSDLDKTMYELYKTRHDDKLLQSLQKLTDDIAKLTIEPITEYPDVFYTAKSTNDHDIKQLFGTFKISDVRTGETGYRGKELHKPNSENKQDMKPKEQGRYLYRCDGCGKEMRTYK